MKTYIIQPRYSNNFDDADTLFNEKIRLIDEIQNDADIIVLPEYSDVPCAVNSFEEVIELHERYIDILLKKCKETAKRCNSTLFFNALSKVSGKYRNTTFALNRNGEVVGKYYKTHIPPAEKALGIDDEYTTNTMNEQFVTIDGIKFAFLTCYDFYFYEAYPKLAKMKPDVIIGCSLQRSDTHSATETICRFLAYNTNTYVIRSSVSYDEASEVCGASMIVSPKGEVLKNMFGKIGIDSAEINIDEKYYKPAGFGRGLSAHYEYIEEGRNPWQYRNSGSSVILDDNNMPYPRVCAHRGFNTIAPENSLPAFGAAVALGAEEIEFDIYTTPDGEIVSIHDETLDRVSDGTGIVWKKTYDELLNYDFGSIKGEEFKGLKIVTFEEILKKFASRVIMNIHVKIWDLDFEERCYDKIIGLIRKYDCEKHVYFMTTNDKVLKDLKRIAPDINICVGHDNNRPYEIVDRAIEIGAQKVQFFKPYFNQEMVDKAHEHGIICNVFYSDDNSETIKYLNMGMDTILSNDYWKTAQIVKEFKKNM